LSFWGISLALTGISLAKSKEKTFEAMKKSRGMMGNMLGEIIAIIFMIGLVLTFIPPESINLYWDLKTLLYHQLSLRLREVLRLYQLLWLFH